MQEIFVGRQPIYNRNLGIMAYELLFRTGNQNAIDPSVSGDGATSQVIINSFVEMGLENLVGRNLACINLSQRFLLSEDTLPVPADRIILDIQQNILTNEHAIKALEQLKQTGFTLALEDVYDVPNFLSIIKLCDIIKLDVKQHSKEQLGQRLSTLKKFNLRMLAEKVETLDEYEAYMDMGFDYFQGYFLSKPRIIKGKSLETNKLSVIKLLSTIHNSNADVSEVENIINKDLTLSYKLLKLINSAFFSLPNKVESIRHAIVFLGRKKLTSWASMLAMSNMQDRPVEMIQIAMIRAKNCELIASQAGIAAEDSYFAVGMFSALDILMQRSIDSLLNPLPLSDEIKQAILDKKGPMGQALDCVLAIETSDWQNAGFADLEQSQLSQLNLQAIAWANEVTQSLQA